MSEMRDEGIDRELLDAWEVPDPPADLADRVLRGLSAQRRSPERRRWPWLAGGGALAAAAVLLLLLRGGGETSGATLTTSRQSLRLGGRAVAVAEEGATLAWRVGGDGTTRVQQSAGDVFYRVEPGGAFVVATPAGEVSVLGTCFRVEVSEMRANRQTVTGAAIGAAASAIIVVSVYEGKVLLANERGKVEVSAGGSARADGEASPALLPSQAELQAPAPGATRDDLLRRDEDQRRELALLRDHIKRLEAGQGGAASQAKAGSSAREVFVDASKEDLAALAAECRITFDHPPLTLEPFALGDTESAALGLSAAQRAELNRRLGDYHGRILGDLRALYTEVTGDREHADDLSPSALAEEITAKSPREEAQLIFQKLSRERAGLASPPQDLRGASPMERYYRLMTGFGDDFERQLATVIGADKAHSMRKKNEGWGSKSGMSAGGCPK